MLYALLDKYPEFYKGRAENASRSIMNVTFNLPSKELEAKFVDEGKQRGLGGLKGHRSVGGIRASIEPGEVTMKDINTVLPFGGTVAVVCVTGRELQEALEASTYCTPQAVGGFPQTCGIEWTLDTTVDYDQGDVYLLGDKESSYYAPASIRRVTIQTVNGEPFAEDKLYVVVTNDFCAAGGDTYNVFNRAYSQGFGFDTGILMDLAVIDYITEVLGGVIGEEYAEPAGMVHQIR